MTYARFEALLERKKQADRTLWLRAGMLASVIVNVSGKTVEKLVKPEDFMPEDPDKKPVDLSKMDAEAQATFFMNLLAKQEIKKH